MPYPPSLLTIAGRLIPKCIYVYSGLGASERCLKQLINCLETFTDRKVVELSADDLLHSNWQNNADLICFSGGYDKGFLSALGMRGCNLVREFVIGGGRYLGICAGAYFASHICEFDKGGENEVIGERQIVLFNGTARGPVYPGFEYKSERGSHAAFLITDDAPCQFPRLVSTYFNGGPAFFSDNWNKTTVLYKYQDKNEPAILLCRLGRGTGLLSGAHFEFDPDMLASQIDVHNSPQTQQILPFLIEFNASRQKLCSYLLDTLLSCGPDELACLQGHGTMVSSTLASSS